MSPTIASVEDFKALFSPAASSHDFSAALKYFESLSADSSRDGAEQESEYNLDTALTELIREVTLPGAADFFSGLTTLTTARRNYRAGTLIPLLNDRCSKNEITHQQKQDKLFQFDRRTQTWDDYAHKLGKLVNRASGKPICDLSKIPGDAWQDPMTVRPDDALSTMQSIARYIAALQSTPVMVEAACCAVCAAGCAVAGAPSACTGCCIGVGCCCTNWLAHSACKE